MLADIVSSGESRWRWSAEYLAVWIESEVLCKPSPPYLCGR